MDPDVVVPFLTVFAVVAGFEFADRTNFALIGLAAREPPFAVWLGAAAAFIVTTLLAVVVGAALLAVLGGQVVYLRLGGGVLLLAYAGYLALVPQSERAPPAGRTATMTAFLLILLLELGDTTMILTMNFVFSIPDPLLVGVAAALGLLAVAATASVIGSRLGARVEPRQLERFVVVVLAIVGVLTIGYALDPGAFPTL
ncbi:MAG TPA: TMEM165/GDT1 family protein [Thermoplasmata archaeon]|nr:TMEM165/GDT1 family protein [Thermoplasmata archaeon]